MIKPEAMPGPTSASVEERPKLRHNKVVRTPVTEIRRHSFSVIEKRKTKRVMRGAKAAAKIDQATITRLKTLVPP